MSRLYPSGRRMIKPSWARWALVLGLLAAYWLMVSSALRKSATVDEPAHIQRGLAYLLTGATQFLLGNPVTGDAIAALPAALEPDLRFPTDNPAWAAGEWGLAANLFMWELGNNGHRLLFLARLTGVWFALGLGALIFHWGRALRGATPGLFAALLFLFDPNVIAHARLVTNDIPAAFCLALSIFGFWQLQRGGWSLAGRDGRWGLLLAGLGLGLGVGIKFTTLVLLPILAALAILAAVKRREARPLAALLLIGLIGWGVIWALAGFAVRPLPGGPVWDDLLWQLSYVGGEHGVYLNGAVSATGWWYYFPFAFLVKTPLTTLILLTAALVLVFSPRPRRAAERTALLFLGLPPLLYFAFTQATAINIGYRYLLSTTPFLVLLIGFILFDPRPEKNRSAWLAPAAWLLLLVGIGHTISIWPNYLTHFNLAAGGQKSGWRLLSDSNVDWGQDLPALAAWQNETGQALNLSYFGSAPPSAYGLRFAALPTWPPAMEQTPAGRQPFYPPDPAPGFYAISVTNLQGVVLGEGVDTYRWFRQKEPLFRAGNSIFVYEIGPTGPTANLVLSGVTPAELPDSIYLSLGTNDVRVSWFDGETGLLYPAGGGRLALRGEMPPRLAATLALFPPRPAAEPWGEGVWLALPSLVEPPWGPRERLGDLGAAELYPPRILEADENRLVLQTIWRANRPSQRPLRVFVHALAADDEMVGQSDRLDVDSSRWQAGDWVIQTHTIDLSGDPVALRLGLYDPPSGQRSGEPVLWPLP